MECPDSSQQQAIFLVLQASGALKEHARKMLNQERYGAQELHADALEELVDRLP